MSNLEPFDLFEDNKNREIDNPLVHKPLSDIEHDAQAFARRINPDAPDEALWVKAARIARDPADWRSTPNLTKQEVKALADEKRLGFWQQPKGLRVTIVTLCFSAILQGWTQTGINGANQGWPCELGLYKLKDDGSGDCSGDFVDNASTWLFAGVNAITYLTAGLCGAWLSDPLQSMFLGRRGAIIVAAGLCLASVIGAGASRNWQQLLVCRMLIGLSMGTKASVTPIFGAEISPSHLRGALVMNWQLFDAFGIFCGFTANLVVSQTGRAAWRYQMASAALPSLCLLSLGWVIPESPRWYLKKGNLSNAFESMCQIRRTPLQAAVELYYANAQVQAEIALLPKKTKDATLENGKSSGHDHNEAKGLKSRARHARNYISARVADAEVDEYQRRVNETNYWRRLIQLFANKRIRRASLAAFTVMIGQQLCGINVIMFYSSTFFSGTSDEDNLRALWLSWGIGLANVIFTFPAYWLIDGHGRRFLLLATYPGMTLSMLAAAMSYAGGERRLGVLGVFTFIFVFFYSWGQGPVPFAYSSEIFPLLNREVGMSFAVFINLFGAGILTMFVPKLTEAFGAEHVATDPAGQQRLLALFTGLNALALVMIFLFMPETAGAALNRKELSRTEGNTLSAISLEEMSYIFGVPTKQHINYQIRHVLPWAARMTVYGIKAKVFRSATDKPEGLTEAYTWKKVSVQMDQMPYEDPGVGGEAEKSEDEILPSHQRDLPVGGYADGARYA